MPRRKLKVTPGMKVLYNDRPATVLKDTGGVLKDTVEIRNEFGYAQTVKLSALRLVN